MERVEYRSSISAQSLIILLLFPLSRLWSNIYIENIYIDITSFQLLHAVDFSRLMIHPNYETRRRLYRGACYRLCAHNRRARLNVDTGRLNTVYCVYDGPNKRTV
jgi:hypothetical protein